MAKNTETEATDRRESVREARKLRAETYFKLHTEKEISVADIAEGVGITKQSVRENIVQHCKDNDLEVPEGLASTRSGLDNRLAAFVASLD